MRITTLLIRTCNLTTIAWGRWSLVTNQGEVASCSSWPFQLLVLCLNNNNNARTPRRYLPNYEVCLKHGIEIYKNSSETVSIRGWLTYSGNWHWIVLCYHPQLSTKYIEVHLHTFNKLSLDVITIVFRGQKHICSTYTNKVNRPGAGSFYNEAFSIILIVK